MASGYVPAIDGVFIYLKPSDDSEPIVTDPWDSDDINGTWDAEAERWTFTVTAGLQYLAYQRLGGSPASTDLKVGDFIQSSGGDGGDIPEPVVPGVCTVRFLVIDSAGQPMPGCYVTVSLDRNSVVETAMVARSQIKAVTNDNGYADIAMIQKEQFSRGGVYLVQISDSSGKPIYEKRVMVPLVDTCYGDELTEL